MLKKTTVLHRNKSPYGWWIFGEIGQWVSRHKKNLPAASRRPVWENLRIIRARNREGAYRKALKTAKAGMPSKTYGGEWRFAGISMLLPIYDKLEDGAEVLWTDHGLMSLRKIQRLAKSKRQLSVFDDREKR